MYFIVWGKMTFRVGFPSTHAFTTHYFQLIVPMFVAVTSAWRCVNVIWVVVILYGNNSCETTRHAIRATRSISLICHSMFIGPITAVLQPVLESCCGNCATNNNIQFQFSSGTASEQWAKVTTDTHATWHPTVLWLRAVQICRQSVTERPSSLLFLLVLDIDSSAFLTSNILLK